MTSLAKHICGAFLVGALLFIPASVGSAARHAKAPCWQKIISEWYANDIKKTFSQHCYQQAIEHLPAPVLIYGTAVQDIEAAAASAGYTVTGPSGPSSQTTSTSPSGDENPPESFPVALIVLGGIAGVLVVSGVAGVLWRRAHPEGDEEE
jgi:hypothetical protein